MDKFIIINVHDATPKKSLIFSSFVFLGVWKKIHVKNNDYFYKKLSIIIIMKIINILYLLLLLF